MPKVTRQKSAKGPSLSKALKLNQSQLAVAFRHIRPTWKHYLDYVEFAAKEGDKELAKFIQAYYGLTRREQVSILPEQICELSGVKTEVLFAGVCGQLWKQSRMECNIITAVHMPKVVEKTMKRAATNQGIKDREMVHKHSGFLPTPKPAPGPNIFVGNQPTAIEQGGKVISLPSMEDEVLGLEDATVINLLPAPERV